MWHSANSLAVFKQSETEVFGRSDNVCGCTVAEVLYYAKNMADLVTFCLVLSNIVEETILLTPSTSGPIACNQLNLAPPGRWHETHDVYSVVVCVDNRS